LTRIDAKHDSSAWDSNSIKLLNYLLLFVDFFLCPSAALKLSYKTNLLRNINKYNKNKDWEVKIFFLFVFFLLILIQKTSFKFY
jgi:hypothetical protein